MIVERVFAAYDPGEGSVVSAGEIEHVTHMSAATLSPLVEMLQRYGFLYIQNIFNEDTEELVRTKFILSTQSADWSDSWKDLLRFCEKTTIPLAHFVVELHFDSLD